MASAGDLLRDRRAGGRQNRSRSPSGRFTDEGAPILPAARQGSEQKASFDPARVAGQADDVRAIDRRCRNHLDAGSLQQFS